MVFPFPVLRSRFGASVPASGKKQHRGSDTSSTSSERMSPNKRTSEWLKQTETPVRRVKQSKIHGVKVSKITKPAGSRTSRSGKFGNLKSPRKDWVSQVWSYLTSQKNDDKPTDDLELEGATVIGDGTPPKSPTPDKTLIDEKTPAKLIIPGGDTTLIGDDNLTPSKSRVVNLKEPEITDKDLYRGWTEDEIWLFEKLDWRGYEPLLPKTWDRDFRTMYELLFTTDDSTAFVKSASENDYHAIKALRGLVKLSGHVRDRVQLGLSVEHTLQREIESYFRWSMQDAGLHKTKHVPAIAIATAVPKESVASVVGRITDQLHHMGKQYRMLWLDRTRCSETDDDQYYVHDLPTLYGVVIKYSVVSFVTYDVAMPGQAVRCVGTYNFQKRGQDVWHALAVGILFIRARNYLMELREEGELGEVDDSDSSDEDA